MPDPIFSDPLLARVYDTFDGARDDLPFYLAIAAEVGARSVLDVGCGTGSFAQLLSRNGFDVTAADPAAASLDVARSKPGVRDVGWICGEAATLPAVEADLAVMTGNVAQVFLTDDAWADALSGIRRALRPGGYLAFESRRPERRAWEEWADANVSVVRHVPGIGRVVQEFVLGEVELPMVSFRYTYRFGDGSVVSSESTLRFRTRRELEGSLAVAGFVVVDVRDAPDRPGHELVFIARAPESLR